jgi:hypothetical protein
MGLRQADTVKTKVPGTGLEKSEESIPCLSRLGDIECQFAACDRLNASLILGELDCKPITGIIVSRQGQFIWLQIGLVR